MEHVPSDPESRGWESIRVNLEVLCAASLPEVPQQEALYSHVGLAGYEEHVPAKETLEAACAGLRSIFEEWRRTADVAGPASQAAQISRGEEDSIERSIFSRLVGRRHPYVPPQSFPNIIAKLGEHQRIQFTNSLASLLGKLADFEFDRLGLGMPVEIEEPAEEKQVFAETKPWIEPTGPSILAGPEAHAADAYIGSVRRHPFLGKDRERWLAAVAQGIRVDNEVTASEARRMLAAHNLRLAYKLARGFVRSRPHIVQAIDDAIQVANLALVKAAWEFGPEREIRFTTVFSRGIFRDLTRWLAKEGMALAGDDRHRDDRRQVVNRVYEEALRLEGPHVTRSEIVARLGYFSQVSIDVMVHEPADPRAVAAFEAVENRLAVHQDVQNLFAEIKKRGVLLSHEVRILKLLYQDGLSLKEVGVLEGNISRQAVSAKEQQALRKIRLAFGIAEPPPRVPEHNPRTFLEMCGVTVGDESDAAVLARAAQLLDDSSLPDRTKHLLRLRFGLDPEQPQLLSRVQAAEILGITVAMAKHYENAGLKVLKAALEA